MVAESTLASWRETPTKAAIVQFIWSRIGRRPLVAGGNSGGDIPVMRFARSAKRDGLRLLALHNDADREFDYVAGAEEAMTRAEERSWTVVSMKGDWERVFADPSRPS